MFTLKEKMPGLLDMYKSYKKKMEKDGLLIRPRDFKRAILLSTGRTMSDKKVNFCLRYIFALFY